MGVHTEQAHSGHDAHTRLFEKEADNAHTEALFIGQVLGPTTFDTRATSIDGRLYMGWCRLVRRLVRLYACVDWTPVPPSRNLVTI